MLKYNDKNIINIELEKELPKWGLNENVDFIL